MQSAGSVVCLVAAACACLLSLASSSAQIGAAQPPRPRHTLLDLVRVAAALPPPAPYSPLQPQQQQQQYNHPEGRSYLPSQQQQQPHYHHHKTFSLTHRPKQPSFDLTPIRPRHALPEFVSVPREENQVLDEDERAVWSKRNSANNSLVPSEDIEGEELLNSFPPVGTSLATNFLRHARSSARPYDVPQIECPPAEDQMERFPCPSPDRMGRYRCIDDHVLCDGFIDCPDGKDEDREQCMFYKTTKAHLDVIADAIIRFIRGRK